MMLNLSPSAPPKMAYRFIRNHLTNRPLIISFEVTLSCNCNCRHCDHGGMKKDERQLQPADYGRIARHFKPVMVQVSGGEPLLREDIVDVVRAIKQAGVPYLIFVTNGALLNEEIYLRLREAGINQFSVSLDYPDERHDEFRRRRGLFKHLEQVIPQLATHGNRDVIMNSVITKANLKETLPLFEKVKEWGVAMSYSVYTPLRTGERDYCIDTEEDLAQLRATIGKLIEMKKRTKQIVNPALILRDTLDFVEKGYYRPGCKSGIRFFVVTPEGDLIPCSLHRDKKFPVQEEMIEKFSCTNQCGSCYVSIRSYCDQSLLGLGKIYGLEIFSR